MGPSEKELAEMAALARLQESMAKSRHSRRLPESERESLVIVISPEEMDEDDSSPEIVLEDEDF